MFWPDAVFSATLRVVVVPSVKTGGGVGGTINRGAGDAEFERIGPRAPSTAAVSPIVGFVGNAPSRGRGDGILRVRSRAFPLPAATAVTVHHNPVGCIGRQLDSGGREPR